MADEIGLESTDASEDPADLEAEVERLREENEKLKHAASSEQSRVGLRWTIVVSLLIVGALLVAAAVGALWLNRTIMDTDRWVETVAPLAEEPAIQDAIATAVTEAVFEEVDVTGMAEEVLPEQLDFLAAPIGAQVEEWVAGLADTIVKSEQFAEVWAEANRSAHTAFVAAATGEGGEVVQIDAGVIAVDTAPMVDLVQVQFEETSLGRISNVIPWERLDTIYVLYESPALAQTQQVLGWMSRLAWLFPLLSLGALGGAVALAPDRRRAMMLVGIAVAIGAAVPLGGIYAGRDVFAQAVTEISGLELAVGLTFFDTVLRFLVNGLRTVAFLGVVIAAASWATGPARPAVQLRNGVASLLGGVSSNLELGAFGAWVAQHKGLLRAFGVAVGVILLVAWDTPTPGVVAGLLVVVLIWIALVEFFGQENEEAPDTGTPPSSTD